MVDNPNMPCRAICPCVARVELLSQRRCADGDTIMRSSLAVDNLATADKRPSTLGFADGVSASAAVDCNADSCLAEIVCRCLHQSSYTYLRRVECSCKAGVVVLHGRLPTYYLKQVAQELIRRFDCVVQVVNSIEVDN